MAHLKGRRRANKYPGGVNKASTAGLSPLLVNLGGNDVSFRSPGHDDMNPQGTQRPHTRVLTQIAHVREPVFCNVPVLDTDILVKGGGWAHSAIPIFHREDASSKQILRLLTYSSSDSCILLERRPHTQQQKGFRSNTTARKAKQGERTVSSTEGRTTPGGGYSLPLFSLAYPGSWSAGRNRAGNSGTVTRADKRWGQARTKESPLTGLGARPCFWRRIACPADSVVVGGERCGLCRLSCLLCLLRDGGRRGDHVI